MEQLIMDQPATHSPIERRKSRRKAKKPIWEVIEDRMSRIDPEAWTVIPPDGAEQHDHYIYGTPKRLPDP
jgi:hypothetical protein